LRARFLRARTARLAEAKARGLLLPQRRGGRYGERLVTLTIPHHLGDSVRGRIELVLMAWKFFLKSLNAWARGKGIGLEFVRVLEWTLGSDGLGHPHLHVWIFSPYLEQAFLSAWWRAALERAGLQLGEQEELLAVDVRPGRKGDGMAQELIKYLCKDIGSDGRYVDPVIFAEVYAALDGRRAVQGSRGFLGRGDGPTPCAECGAADALRVRVVPNLVERKARAAEDMARVGSAHGAASDWSEQLAESLKQREEAAADIALPRARECAVCTAMGRDARLERRNIDGRTCETLCDSCRSILGRRHLSLSELKAEVLRRLTAKGNTGGSRP
jgi:hypothetical protein